MVSLGHLARVVHFGDTLWLASWLHKAGLSSVTLGA